ncbi:DUF2634 domain-containing protein [Paenibacillus gansuensis]|uniref:DUF2634 domain-containing protein n=1 Tax=Paenibacillus gansuensis TaxID=306542 RepID=A0ABW5PIM8_9BACL
MSLPEIAQLEYEVPETTASNTVHMIYDWDFEKNDFKLKDGKLVELTGLDYIKIWIQKALRTKKDEGIYAGTGYGSEHHSMIGLNLHPDLSRSEYERMIQEALLQNDAIIAVENFTFTQEGSRMTAEFFVSSIYGESKEEVMF